MPLSVPSGVDQGDLALSFAHMLRDDRACAVLVFDREQRVLSQSSNLARVLDLKNENLVGAHASALPPNVCDLVQRTTQSVESSCDTEFLGRADQESHSFRLTALP